MERVQLTSNSLRECVLKAAEHIRDGGVVMIPTDTCYGLAANPHNTQAMEKLFSIKRRAEDKKVSCVYPSLASIAAHIPLSTWQQEVLGKNLPGPFTFIINDESVRMPKHPFTQALADTLGDPYTATSANISGNPPLYSAAGVIEEFGEELPDFVIDAGELPNNPPSTVVDISNDTPVTIRSGSGIPIIEIGS